MPHVLQVQAVRIAAAALLLVGTVDANADAITDWNVRAGDILVEAKLGTPPAIRTMAIVQVAVHDAVNEITGRYPASSPRPDRARGASIEAAVAAANRGTLGKLVPAQQAAIDAAYQAALAQIADGPAKSAGIAIGEKAAASVVALRGNDGASAAESYRPATTAGVYVPTATPAVPQWPQRKPWLMTSAAQFRPASPPALTGEAWARDYNEVKAFGGRTSIRRSAEQADIARFWEYSLPPIYYSVVRSVASMPGREVTQNARLYAAVAQAMDDAMIGVFEAKYHYGFWRPASAIRNGDLDGNDATERDATWVSFVEAPMHPEYPSAHSSLAAAVAAVVKAEVGSGSMPVLTTSSPTLKGAQRKWTNADDFTREVGNSRIYAGIHYRASTDAGAELGRQIGELTVAKFLQVAD